MSNADDGTPSAEAQPGPEPAASDPAAELEQLARDAPDGVTISIETDPSGEMTESDEETAAALGVTVEELHAMESEILVEQLAAAETGNLRGICGAQHASGERCTEPPHIDGPHRNGNIGWWR